MKGAGRRDRQVTIQSNTPSTTDYGNKVDSWSTLRTAWASFELMTGGEKIEGSVDVARQKAKFGFAYVDASDVTEADRISYNSKIWDILSIQERGRESELIIIAEWQEIT